MQVADGGAVQIVRRRAVGRALAGAERNCNRERDRKPGGGCGHGGSVASPGPPRPRSNDRWAIGAVIRGHHTDLGRIRRKSVWCPRIYWGAVSTTTRASAAVLRENAYVPPGEESLRCVPVPTAACRLRKFATFCQCVRMDWSMVLQFMSDRVPCTASVPAGPTPPPPSSAQKSCNPP